MSDRAPKCRPGPSSRKQRLIGADLERCIYCDQLGIKRQGKRYKKMEVVQLWYCAHCDVVFTAQRVRGKTYPLKVILESLMLYYRGETRESVAKRIKSRFGVNVSTRTISNWLAEYRELTSYAKLRQKALKEYRPSRVIRSMRLHHQQVYQYCIHQGKLDQILAMRKHRSLAPMGNYLMEMADGCPHKLFQTDARASQGKAAFNLEEVEIRSKRNNACEFANLVLQTVTQNRRRHDEIQRFMLTVDSVTVAVEVPIYLDPADLRHMTHKLGFEIPLEADQTLTGHIDILQIRNGKIHIVDYKPGAKREKPIVQLMVYALALSRRTGLRLFDFVCSWFDEHHYYEFYPLHVVHKVGRTKERFGPDDWPSAWLEPSLES